MFGLMSCFYHSFSCLACVVFGSMNNLEDFLIDIVLLVHTTIVASFIKTTCPGTKTKLRATSAHIVQQIVVSVDWSLSVSSLLTFLWLDLFVVSWISEHSRIRAYKLTKSPSCISSTSAMVTTCICSRSDGDAWNGSIVVSPTIVIPYRKSWDGA